MKARRRLLTAGIFLGSLMMLFPVAAIVVGVQTAYRTLGVSGIGDPRSLSGALTEILVATALFLPLFAGGLAILILSLVHRRKLPGFQPPPLPPSVA